MPSFPNSVKQFGSLDQRDDIFAEVMALETFCLGTDQKLTTMAAVDMNTATSYYVICRSHRQELSDFQGNYAPCQHQSNYCFR
jgi:hypothetical protein